MSEVITVAEDIITVTGTAETITVTEIYTASGGGGVSDHGGLSGLTDDDHTQYLNVARGDARYYTESEVDTQITNAKARSNHTGTQLASTISDFSTAADARIALQRNAVDGIAGLDSGGKVPASLLPSYVDDVIEAANFAALPGTGETGKIYVALDTGKIYRWTGSAYVEISASPGSTDSVAEGVTNLYFTVARVLAAVLTGFSTATSTAVTAADTVLQALGKLQAQITANIASIATNTTAVATKAKRVLPPNGTLIVEDFLGSGGVGNEGFTQTAGGGTFSLNATLVTDRDGVVSMRTGASASASPTISMGSGINLVFGTRRRAVKFGVRVADLATVAEDYVLRSGFFNVFTGAAVTNGIWFEYNRAATGDFWVIKSITTAASSTTTVSSIPVTVDTWFDLRIELNDAGTSASFYVNDVLAGTITTNLPTGSSRPVAPISQIYKTAGTTERIQYIDYVVYGSGLGADQVSLVSAA